MRFSFRNVARIELDEAEAGKSTGIAILSFISVVTLIFYFFVKNALAVIRVSLKYFNIVYYPGDIYLLKHEVLEVLDSFHLSN